MIEIIKGIAYEKLPDNYLEEEITKRKDDIVKLQEILIEMQTELDTLTVKKVEQTTQLEPVKIVK